jgi:hypothetical protein
MNPRIAAWVSRLKDASVAARREAIQELEAIGDPEALIPLAQVFCTDPDPETRLLAQKSGKIIYFNQLRKQQLESGASEEERRRAAEILAKAQAKKLRRR